MPDTLVEELEEFTCAMYGYVPEKSVNVVRHLMMQKMVGEGVELTTESKIDLSKLPPDRDSLTQHIKRANYRVATYKLAKEPIFWKPDAFEGHGWVRNDKNILEPLWSTGPILPQTLIDLVQPTKEELQEAEEIIEYDPDEVFDDE